MKPSIVRDEKRTSIRQAVLQFRTTNPRVFGSVLNGTDYDDSDLDVLVDALPSPAFAGMDKDAFFAEVRTQQAVMLNILIVGEAATPLLRDHPDVLTE